MKRQEIIDRLIGNDINTIIDQNERGDNSYVADIFEYGMKGYANFTDEELITEHIEIFNERVEIEEVIECSECGWEGTHEELRTAMIPNEHNIKDHTLYEVKTCPDCGNTIIKK
jgi:predicted RNA-binding Zn-ribbon protein involved in translation (DUF1610 family)